MVNDRSGPKALQDHVVVVTGASRGLGRSMALRLSKEGASVVLVARRSAALEAVAADAVGPTLVAPADVRDAAAVEAVIERTRDRFGRVDATVNNAGVALLSLADERKRIVDVEEDEWDTVIDVNLKGAFLFMRAVLPELADRGRGNVINVSSALGRRPEARMGPYVASKFGLEGLSRSVALELEDTGVNVNCIDPGGRVDTGFFDHVTADRRAAMRDPDVMNDAIVGLVSQGPDGVTGESMGAKAWEERLDV